MGVCSPFIPYDVGVWADYVPTWSGFTKGNGILNTARYVQIGNTVIGEVHFTLGSSSVVTGGIGLSPPVPIASPVGLTVGQATLLDQGTSTYAGLVVVGSASLLNLQALTVGGTYGGATPTSAAVPHAWANTDGIWAPFRYEAA